MMYRTILNKRQMNNQYASLKCNLFNMVKAHMTLSLELIYY
jgi:hypothetical protein